MAASSWLVKGPFRFAARTVEDDDIDGTSGSTAVDLTAAMASAVAVAALSGVVWLDGKEKATVSSDCMSEERVDGSPNSESSSGGLSRIGSGSDSFFSIPDGERILPSFGSAVHRNNR